jgi:hypothetical protein
MCEENPKRIYRHGEEMVEEQDGIRRETGNFGDNSNEVIVTIVINDCDLARERGSDGNSPREQRDWTLDAFTATLEVLEAPGTQNSKILVCVPASKNRSVRVGQAARTVGTKEVVQRKAQDVDRRCEGFACPVPPVEHVRERVPVSEVWFCGDHRREEHDVRQGDSHATAGERMAHIPCVAKEDDALFGVWPALLDGWEE